MTDYKLYPNLPSAPPENAKVVYHLSIIQAKMQGLKNKEQMFNQKYEKYPKNGIISVLAKKYQKKLKKVTGLIDIVTPALVVFERVISGALKNGIIDEEEFNTLQTLHLETLNKLMGVDRRMEVENRSLVEKSLMEEINELKKKAETKV